MSRQLTLLLAICVSTGPTTRAHSAPTVPTVEQDAIGRRHFERGQELFRAKRYLEAAREFEAGYEASGRTGFLFNAGQSYRRAGELERSKEVYEKLLRLDPTTSKRQEIEEHIASINDALLARNATARPATPAPPPVPPIPVPPPAPVRPPAPLSAPTSQAEPTPPLYVANPAAQGDTADEPIFRKTWFWVVVGGVVAAGATAAVLAVRSTNSGCDYTWCGREMPLPSP